MKIHGGGFMTTIATIKVGDEEHRVLPKDYQLHPVRDFVEHVDFLRVSKKTIVTVEIPVNFENDEECPGLKRGGVLNIVRHTVEVNCPADSIPDGFDIDLTPFELGDSINISSVTLPEGVEPTITDRDFTIATIAAPAGLKSEEEDEEGAPEAPETEIIGEEKDAEEARSNPSFRRLEPGHADHCRTWKPRRQICRTSPQYRLYGGGRNRSPSRVWAMEIEVQR